MILIIALIAVPILIIILLYNSLVRSKNDVENAFGGMDVQLKKRYDLIPNLVSTVKQYASHEKDLLENVTKLRAKVTDGQLSNDEKVALDNEISRGIGGIMVAVENYPDLKASENFINLQRTLNEVESQISASRRAYNSAVTDYNNAVETFPKNILAGMMSYKRKEVFVIQEAERQNVDVSKLF
ncbi:MAG: LemA family protein [Cyclobacteriaceae bacterium]